MVRFFLYKEKKNARSNKELGITVVCPEVLQKFQFHPREA